MNQTIWWTRHVPAPQRNREIIGGGTDRPLDDSGLKLASVRAKQLAQAVREGRLHLGSTVVASPLLRARQTAEIFAEELGCTLVEYPELRAQHFGDLEAKTVDEIEASHLVRHLHSNVPPERLYTDAAPGGEAIDEAVARVHRVRAELLNAYDYPLVVSHGSLLKALILTRNNVPPQRWNAIASQFKGMVIRDTSDGLHPQRLFN